MSPVLLVVGVGVLLILGERIAPAWRWPVPPLWWARAAVLNGIQAGVSFLGTATWDHVFSHGSMMDGPHGSTGIALGYLLVTFVYYWWHRARHEIPPLWRWLHQVHHSPARIEVITSFYKHPLEILLNGMLSSALLYLVLGLHPGEVAVTVAITGLAELIYHWNVRTPRWLGWFFQRPEMHRIHHQRGSHTHNFSDLPLWDALFGTLRNPRLDMGTCGFPNQAETRLWDLLTGTRVEEV